MLLLLLVPKHETENINKLTANSKNILLGSNTNYKSHYQSIKISRLYSTLSIMVSQLSTPSLEPPIALKW
jgi:hypothetical protein